MPLSPYVQHVSDSACSISSEQVFPLYSFCFLRLNNFYFYNSHTVIILCPAYLSSSFFILLHFSSFSSYFLPFTHYVLAYSTTSVTTPAPTVLPPSLTANLNSFSIAIGAINSISIVTLSPGITISTPSGNFATPVTSVVLK